MSFGVRLADWLRGIFHGADPRVCVAFWLFGLINNVLYVVLLSAALDLVGPDVPKGVVLLADIIPSFGTKLIAPYFIHLVPYSIRVILFVFLSVLGMLVVATSPSYTDGGTIGMKIAGIVLASLSAGGGELSFVGLTHFYGPFSLAAWGSGTGAAGLIGAGAYALATSALKFSVQATLLASAILPALMALSFFVVLPRGAMQTDTSAAHGYRSTAQEEDAIDESPHAGGREADSDEEERLLRDPVHAVDAYKPVHVRGSTTWWSQFRLNFALLQGLFIPFMLPLLLVYIAEYVINQGVSPTLLFPLDRTPFENFRAFYPAYNAIYQAGVFISRSSTPFFRVHHLYIPSFLQIVNLGLLTVHAMFDFIPNVYIVFMIIFWEGLLGGLVYVNTFAEIADRVPKQDREFSLGATTVSDSAGICIAGFLNHVLGRPSTRFRKIQVFAVVSFWSLYLLKADKHGPPFVRSISSRLSGKLTSWQTTVIIFLWLYVSRNFAKIVGLECPEPLANLYSRSFFRATWITTGLDAGFWTAMKIKPKWLRDLASLIFTVYYLIAAEQADEKVRRVRGTLTLEHLRVSWNKATTPYLWFLANLLRPRLTNYGPRAIRIPRPKQSAYTEPVNAWMYFDGPLSALKGQTCVVLDVPGGGFVAMGPRHSEDKLLSWAGKLKVPILSIDYRKAPEYAYPYALHECFDVYHTIMATNGRCLGLNGSTRPRVVVTGESAGGNLAVGMTLMVLQSAMTQGWQGDNVLPRPDGVVLAYPALNVKVESWMTDEQMSLIQDKSCRQTNNSVLQRKQDQYRKLTPYTSPGHSVENLTALTANGSKKPAEEHASKSEARESDIATETIKALHDKFQKSDRVAGDTAPEPVRHANPLKTRLAVSSMISYVHDRILTPEMMRAMIILYIGPHHRPDFNTDFYLSPVLAPDALLAQFPKIYILTGERDPLVDDTVIFAGRLRQAKLQRFHERQELGLEKSTRQFNEKDHVEVSLIPGVSHGFIQMAGFFPEAWKYINRSAQWIEGLLGSTNLQSSEYSLLQLSNMSSSKLSRRGPHINGHGSGNSIDKNNSGTTAHHHHRNLTGESSADEDRPLEMSMSKINASAAAPPPMPPPGALNGSRHKSSLSKSKSRSPSASTTVAEAPLRRRRSKSSFASSHLQGLTTLGHQESRNVREFRAKLKQLEMSRGHGEQSDFPEEITSAPESPATMRPGLGRGRSRSITSLDSEEDILDRRMNGLASGLMGMGDGAKTPGS
ncbi:Protein btn1 [Penicillium ucsense]|uniref:Protein btn1 n=1 Tax=Penicillium ucsense TaxID=2839758 RepID=A0A8J8WG84_9EURO|nr:Protein btn1 [Penicillium ucsense]KAF7736755.1 Protein btn1 [Penicillium ucsense]